MAGKAGEQAKWTLEPWRYDEFGCVESASGRIATLYTWYADNNLREENGRRIVACVNALAGVPDPAAHLARCARMEEALKKLSSYFDTGFDIPPTVKECLTTERKLTRAEELAEMARQESALMTTVDPQTLAAYRALCCEKGGGE